MEIERYTLARARPRSPLRRYWKPWADLLRRRDRPDRPGWARRDATTFTYLVGGNPTTVAIIVCIAIAVALTTSPVVYKALDGGVFKVGLDVVFLAI